MVWQSRGRRRVALLAVLAGAVAGGCGGSDDDGGEQGTRAVPAAASYAGQPARVADLQVPARATATHVQLATNGAFADRFWPGVNLGSTTPGHLPGEVSARAADYRRWFPEMAALGVRVVRVYTLLDPSFYTELRAYNEAHPDAPLYVIHGVWIPEERFLATSDLWDAQVLAEMDALVDEVHAAVRGDLQRAERRGMASGTWTADIRPWVIAWSPGVEWDPVATERSERTNPPRGWDGTYIRTTAGATSTEAWIARAADRLARLDAESGWSRAMTFTNWLTADPLEHPHEPLAREDAIAVDAMHLRATDAWPGGFFASYHAYPYYPDFLRLEPRYRRAPDSYRAYLRDLRRHHQGQALMVTEFGVPSSLGKAHLGPQGRDQGDHPEQEALRMDADMLATIRAEGLAGGVLFAWTDEWFNLTWNTVDTEIPADRRALWRSPLTNEEHFGVIATEPGERAAATIDGDDREWRNGQSQLLTESRGPVRELRVTHDASYLHLRLRFDSARDRRSFRLGLDVRPGANRGLPGVPGGRAMPGADVALTADGDRVRLWQAAWTDPLALQYGIARRYLRVDPRDVRRRSGAWREPALILNRPYRVPVSGERRPIELQRLSPLAAGSEARDSRTLMAAKGEVLELRLPWALLGFADPSSRTLVVPRRDGTIGTAQLPAARRIAMEAYDARGSRTLATPGYGFEGWQQVTYRERRKRGWDTLRDAYARAAAAPGASGR